MSHRKIILYPKSAMKPIILTDTSNVSLKEIQDKVMEIFKDNKVFVFSTDSDSLIVKPSEIQAVLITKKDFENTSSDTKYSQDLKQ